MNRLTTRLQHHNLNRNGAKSNWTIRRRIVALTLSFCAAMVVWVVYKDPVTSCAMANMVPVDPDVAVKTVVVQSAFFLAAAVIGSYVFGATWEDRKKMDLIADEDPAPPQTPPKADVNNPDVQAQLNGSN